jgi:hypothetical protein
MYVFVLKNKLWSKYLGTTDLIGQILPNISLGQEVLKIVFWHRFSGSATLAASTNRKYVAFSMTSLFDRFATVQNQS